MGGFPGAFKSAPSAVCTLYSYLQPSGSSEPGFSEQVFDFLVDSPHLSSILYPKPPLLP